MKKSYVITLVITVCLQTLAIIIFMWAIIRSSLLTFSEHIFMYSIPIFIVLTAVYSLLYFWLRKRIIPSEQLTIIDVGPIFILYSSLLALLFSLGLAFYII